jgi:phosphoglycolate phosphatase-like HAD superfamily hydrolase
LYIKHALVKLAIDIDVVIGYERGGFKKPSPEPMLKALDLLRLTNKQVIAIGDEERDSLSAKAAGITNITVGNRYSSSDFFVKSLNECIKIIEKLSNKNNLNNK